ncbi:DUF1214 domain-containing protein [Paraburkholderia mimosarum]|uniref:DUF1214 domain-containing protein n=1 Tax=Paraburkholderia mimosarum TaxID=312026 RepID=UPI0039C18301
MNPLATTDQQQLDARAFSIYTAYDFSSAKATVKSAYEAAYGSALDAQESATLDAAVDELTFASIQKEVNSDPYRPKVYELLTPPKTWLGIQEPGGRYAYDNPDAIYRWIPISGSEQYVIHGHRYADGPSDVTFSLINNVNSQGTIAYLSASDLVIDNNGDYTVTIDSSAANGRPNHIQSTSAAVQLFVRNNLGDWSTETPDSLTVERVSTTKAPPALTDSAIAGAATQDLLTGGTNYGKGLLSASTLSAVINTIGTPKVGSGLVTQANSYSHFSIASDEALMVTLNPGGAGYFVLPVTNPWMVSVDPDTHQSSLNSSQAVANADGTYTFVISPEDPGVYNWVDTVGMTEGTIMLRLQKLASSKTANVSVQSNLVKLTQLASVLPAGTRYVTPAERQQIVAARSAGYARRRAVP